MDHLPLTRSGPWDEYPDAGPLPPLVRMQALWPDLEEPERPYEVVATLPRADGGDPLVPRTLPAVVLGCWSAEAVTVSVTVLASRPSAALAAAEVLVPELAGAAGAEVKVRAVAAGG